LPAVLETTVSHFYRSLPSFVSFISSSPQTTPHHLSLGGDGLVCARHLHHYGYTPTIYYPKQTSAELFSRLVTQLKTLSIPFTPDFSSALSSTDFVIDAIFGFSVRLPIKSPFDAVISAMEKTSKPVFAIDTPSSWDVEGGPQGEGEVGHGFMPDYLISLTAPKPSAKFFKGKRHFIGGRFLSKQVAEKYGLDVPDYQGYDQIAELPIEEGGGKL
jgi:NAD(P)H-hydrate epimerase